VTWAEVLGDLDAWTLSLIFVSAGFYASALVAAGSVMLKLVFRDMPACGQSVLARQLVIAAWLGISLVLLQWPLQAAFLGGGTVASAFDPFLLAVIFESAQGNRILLAISGLVLLHAALLERGRIGFAAPVLGVLGAVIVLLAFVQVGHTRDEPRWLLGGLLLLHLAAVAFWIAALIPLHRLARSANDDRATARLLAQFGRVAVGVVGLLLVAGAFLGWMLVGGLQPLLATGYGQVLFVKLLLVAALLAVAAWNKWRLVPAFERGDATARARLRRSIRGEMLLVLAILLATALLTTTASPGG
jgi:putative copper resistance protein D